jgi:hypothetical protein
MSTGRHAFKSTEAARLIRATKAAGLPIKGVTIKDGKPYVDIDAPADDANTGASEWDERIKQNATEDAKRTT